MMKVQTILYFKDMTQMEFIYHMEIQVLKRSTKVNFNFFFPV